MFFVFRVKERESYNNLCWEIKRKRERERECEWVSEREREREIVRGWVGGRGSGWENTKNKKGFSYIEWERDR